MVLTSQNLAISYTIDGSQPLSSALTITSSNTSPLDLSGEYSTTIINMFENIDLYKVSTAVSATQNFIDLQTNDIAILLGLEGGLEILDDYGNKSLAIITEQSTNRMLDILALIDPLLPYTNNQDQVYYFWVELNSFQETLIELLSSESALVKISPSITSQSISGGTPITRTSIQSVANVSEQLETVRTNIKNLYNNDTNLSAAIAAIESVVTGVIPTTDNQEQINLLRQEIADLEFSKSTATPEQIILINEQIIELTNEIKNLEKTGTKLELPSQEVLRIKTLVDTYTSQEGSDAIITMTGQVIQSSGYPLVPMGTTVVDPIITTTGTKSQQIAQLRESIVLIETNQLALNAQYNAQVAAGTVTTQITEAYNTATRQNSAQILSLEQQIANLQAKNTYNIWNWNWWNWSNNGTIWSWPNNYIGRYNGNSSSNRKKNLNKTLAKLTTLIENPNPANPSFQGVVSKLTAIITANTDDYINLNYSFYLNDQGWSVVIQNMPVYQINEYLASVLRTTVNLPNAQRVNLCKMFGVNTSSAPTQQNMKNAFLVALFTYIPCALFILKNLEQAGEYIQANLEINVLKLIETTSLVTMSNSAIPFFSQGSFDDTNRVMQFGVLKAFTPFMLNGNSSILINSSSGLITANVARLYYRGP